MTNKNINQGEITTESGDVHIGDKITNLIDGLSLVLHEYKQQLKSIEQLINDFKPRTALKLLEEIELRITENGINDNLIQSKILFLKATCKSELFDYPIQVTANEFIFWLKMTKGLRKRPVLNILILMMKRNPWNSSMKFLGLMNII